MTVRPSSAAMIDAASCTRVDEERRTCREARSLDLHCGKVVGFCEVFCHQPTLQVPSEEATPCCSVVERAISLSALQDNC